MSGFFEYNYLRNRRDSGCGDFLALGGEHDVFDSIFLVGQVILVD